MTLSQAYKEIIETEAEEKHYNSNGAFVTNCNYVLDFMAPAVAINFLNWTLSTECDYIPSSEEGMFAHYETNINISTAELFDIFVNNFYFNTQS